MGVLTTVYSIPPDIIRKTQRNKKLLLNIFEGHPDWRFESFGFDKAWEETIEIIGVCYPRTRNTLEARKFRNYFGYDAWSVTPKNVKFAADELASATFESLKEWGLKAPAMDYYGKPIAEEFYTYYVGGIEELKTFLRKTATDENYLLFATA